MVAGSILVIGIIASLLVGGLLSLSFCNSKPIDNTNESINELITELNNTNKNLNIVIVYNNVSSGT